MVPGANPMVSILERYDITISNEYDSPAGTPGNPRGERPGLARQSISRRRSIRRYETQSRRAHSRLRGQRSGGGACEPYAHRQRAQPRAALPCFPAPVSRRRRFERMSGSCASCCGNSRSADASAFGLPLSRRLSVPRFHVDHIVLRLTCHLCRSGNASPAQPCGGSHPPVLDEGLLARR